MQSSQTNFFKVIQYIVTCKAQCIIIRLKFGMYMRLLYYTVYRYVGCWLSPLCIHSHFFLVFSTFSFICTLNERQKHQLHVYVQISLKSQVAVCFVYTVHQVYCVMFLYQLSGSCGSPRSLSKGQRRYSRTTVGSRVTYTCNPGYRMTSGSSSRTCQLDGQWSGSHPTCTRKSTLCHFNIFYILTASM